MMNRADSFTRKWRELKRLLERKEKRGILLETQASVSWLTGARSFINLASTQSVMQLYVTRDRVHVIVNNIEAKRMEEEECTGLPGGVLSFDPYPWHDSQGARRALERAASAQAAERLDERECAEDLGALQSILDPYEQMVLEDLSRDTAQAVEEAAAAFVFQESEYTLAGRLSRALWERGVEPLVLLAAGDERTAQRRHPLPTHGRVESYAILSVCGRRQGLVASVTRSVHRGPLPQALRKKQEAVAFVDAAAIVSSQPGVTLQEVFEAICRAYESQAYPQEWMFHHQGGLTGYATRSHLAAHGVALTLQPGMALAYNPTVSGTKSEDTCLLGSRGAVILTQSGGPWPMLSVDTGGKRTLRPAILER